MEYVRCSEIQLEVSECRETCDAVQYVACHLSQAQQSLTILSTCSGNKIGVSMSTRMIFRKLSVRAPIPSNTVYVCTTVMG